MALTLVLLVGAGLLFRTIRHMWDTHTGFDTQHVITFKVGFSPSLTKTASSMRTAYRQLLERVRTIPGVQAADFTYIVPLIGEDNDLPLLDWLAKARRGSIGPADDGIRHGSRLSPRDGNTARPRPFFHAGRHHEVPVRRGNRHRFCQRLFSRSGSARPGLEFRMDSAVGPLPHRRRGGPRKAVGAGQRELPTRKRKRTFRFTKFLMSG